MVTILYFLTSKWKKFMTFPRFFHFIGWIGGWLELLEIFHMLTDSNSTINDLMSQWPAFWNCLVQFLEIFLRRMTIIRSLDYFVYWVGITTNQDRGPKTSMNGHLNYGACCVVHYGRSKLNYANKWTQSNVRDLPKFIIIMYINASLT